MTTDFLEDFAARHAIDAHIALYEDLRLADGTEPRGPKLCLDDVSEIPFLVGVSGVELYQHRARVRARDGDLFAAVTPTVDGYEPYCERLGFGSTTFVHAPAVDTPLAVAKACSVGAAFEQICKIAKDAGALTVFPYMAIEPVWALAAGVRAETGADVRVNGAVPDALWIANDKASLSELVRGLLGDEFLVPTYAEHDAMILAKHLATLAESHATVGLKRTRCASAMGNRTFDGAHVRGMDHAGRVALVEDFFAETECAPGETVLAVAWLATDCSPSTQLLIPREGEPIVDGVYEQILTRESRVFVGSRPSGLRPEVDEALSKASIVVAKAFQRLGYVGRCSFDFLVDEPDGDFSIHFTECNGRWGGTSIPMQMVDHLRGTPRPHYRAQDVAYDGLIGVPFTEVLDRMGDDDRFVFYNVGPLTDFGKMDVIAFGDSPDHCDELMLDVLPRKLGL